VGALRQKNNELQAEITNLRKEVKKLERDHDQYQSFEKRANGLAAQIKEMQGDLGDLNMLEEQIQQHIDVEDVEVDVQELKTSNDQESAANDEIFAERQRVDNLAAQVTAEIEVEKQKADGLVDEMDAGMKAQYMELKAEAAAMQDDIDGAQGSLDGLEQQIMGCESELSRNPIKREAVNLQRAISELTVKRDNLAEEMAADDKGTPEEQRERMLGKVKEDNQAISAMTQKIQELTNRVNEVQTAMADLDEDEDDGNDEKRRKYQELVKRDEEMENFFVQFPKLKEDEVDRINTVENQIVAALDQISTDMARTGSMPSRKEANDEKKLLEHRQKELDKSESTARSLDERRARLQKDMANVNQLESKIQTEMETLNEKIARMTTELVTYNDIDGLKEVTDRRKRQLLSNRERLVLRRDTSKSILAQLGAVYESAKGQLLENETYTQLLGLEKKWQGQERQNHTHKHYILTQETESNFKPFVKQVTSIMKEYNTELKAREPVKAPVTHAV
jgi:intraflagellar transport protein 74